MSINVGPNAGEGFAATANLVITDVTSGTAETIVVTDGKKTKTIVMNNTTNGITITWS